MKKRLMFLISALVICSYVIGQTYTEVEKYYNKIAATHKVEKKLDGYNFYSITNKEAVEILGGCYHWGSSGNGSLALVVGENETYAVLDFAQDLFPNPPYSNVTGSVTEKAVFLHDGVWSVGKAGGQIIFRCFKCSVKIYLIDYKNTQWVGNHWTSPDKPTQFWFAVTPRNLFGFRMGQMEWEPMTKENVRLGEKQSSKDVLTQLEAEKQAELEKQQTARGAIGDNITWELVGGELTVTGEGKMNFRDYKDVPWLQYRENIKSVRISNGITNIGNDAFFRCSELISVAIPNSVTSIGGHAFQECYSLTSITIPNSVSSIEGWAFYSCGRLSSLIIPNSVTHIGKSAFSGVLNIVYNGTASGSPWDAKHINSCVEGWLVFEDKSKKTVIDCAFNAKTVTIPNSVTNIKDYSFYGANITSVTIPNSVTRIGQSAFMFCNELISLNIPNSVTSIGKSAFYDCHNITNLTIGNSVTSIGERTFYGCSALTTIKIPSSVEYIGFGAFEGCSGLTSIEIPTGIAKIDNFAFADCSGLTSMVVKSGNTIYDSRKNCNAIIETATNTLIAGCKNTTIPNSVTSIADDAFHGCTGLASIEIPNSVTSIGERAFRECSGLTRLEIPNSVTHIGERAFAGCNEELSFILPCWLSESVGKDDFKNVTFYHSDDDELWNMAKKKNTEDSYKMYLRCSETIEHYEEANKALERIYSSPEWIEANMWKNVINSNSSEKYIAYLTQYPQGKFTDKAKEKLWNNNEDKCWANFILKKDDIEPIDIYLKVYPEGKYKTQAEERKENLIWGKAVKDNTVRAYDNYLEKYPTGKYATNAINKRNIAQDNLQWNLTKESASLSSYKYYTQNAQAYCTHVKEAESIISEMEQEGVTFYYYLDGMKPQGHKVFYETFLQYPCGNKAMSWKCSLSKLKGIAKKEQMRRTDDYSSRDYFRCTSDYRYLNVKYYKDFKELCVYWKGNPSDFFGESLSLIASHLEKIGVKWGKKPYGNDIWIGTYQYEGQTIYIRLDDNEVAIYVKK